MRGPREVLAPHGVRSSRHRVGSISPQGGFALVCTSLEKNVSPKFRADCFGGLS